MTVEILHISFAGPVYSVTDARGKLWRFTYHDYFGPEVVNKDDNVSMRQPGIKSPFWEAVKSWEKPKDHRNCTCGSKL